MSLHDKVIGNIFGKEVFVDVKITVTVRALSQITDCVLKETPFTCIKSIVLAKSIQESELDWQLLTGQLSAFVRIVCAEVSN